MNVHEPDEAALAARWRAALAARGIARLPIEPEPDAAARLEALFRRRLTPPAEGLPPRLAQVAAAWQPDWTAALRATKSLQDSKSREEARTLLAAGQRRDAGRELELLFSALPAARAILYADRPRELARNAPAPDAEHAGLAALLDWLDALAEESAPLDEA
jgi:hypothetical protein